MRANMTFSSAGKSNDMQIDLPKDICGSSDYAQVNVISMKNPTYDYTSDRISSKVISNVVSLKIFETTSVRSTFKDQVLTKPVSVTSSVGMRL